MRYLCLPAAIFYLLACQTTPLEPATAVLGTWEWEESSGGIQGHVLTPESEGYTVTLTLLDDGTALAHRDGELVGESAYRVLERLALVTPGSPREYEITFEPALQLFEFTNAEGFVLRVPTRRSLRLVSPCCDRYDHTFSRKSQPER